MKKVQVFYYMCIHMENDVERYNPEPEQGLSNAQVAERVQQKLTNKTTRIVGKTYLQIVVDNVFNFFNILLYIMAGLLIFARKYDSLFFLVILVCNMGIGLFEDIHARRLMDKLQLVTQPKITAIREGKQVEIPTEEIVLDDVVGLSAGLQIPADGEILEGTILVNESLLTGEPKAISKTVGDSILSGSFVVSGNALAKATKVGKDSYVETLQSAAKKFKRSKSEILIALNKLFGVIGFLVIIIGVSTAVLYLTQGLFSTHDNFRSAMGSISGFMVSMIPSGLYLLTSVALATAVIRLSKEKARVQDFYSVEMLARINLLCVDKTGTITDGTMTVQKIIPYGAYSEGKVTAILTDYAHLSRDNNATENALKDYFIFSSNATANEILDFNSENKYSAITFNSGETFVLGAAECIDLKNKAGVLLRVEEYAKKGMRVLVIAKAPAGITDGKIKGICDPIGMVVLQDHIRTNAAKTFQWFNDNGVAIRVISGDDPVTVSEIARQAGVANSDRYISLAGMSIEEVKEVADKYIVFGRVTPDQKEALVMKFKETGNTVAMTGDGINDILALKRADCSIAMASGAEAAKNVSHIVLLDSDFDHLPSVVDQGRRVINNLQRTCSLFLVKTSFAIFFSITFLIAGLITKNPEIRFPFLTNNLYIWEVACVGIPAFFLALEPNANRLNGTFFRNVFKKAIPPAIAIILGVVVIFMMYHFQNYGVMYTGIYTQEAAVAMCSIMFTIISIFGLMKVCIPFNKYRLIIFSASATLCVGLLVGAAILTYKVGYENSLFRIPFTEMNLVNYFETIVITVILSTLYIGITHIIVVLKGERLNDKN